MLKNKLWKKIKKAKIIMFRENQIVKEVTLLEKI